MRATAAILVALYLAHILTGGLDRIIEPPVVEAAADRQRDGQHRVAEGVGQAPLLPTEPRLAALVSATSAGQSLLETIASQLLLHGNAYVQVMKDAAGRPVELFALRPERVSARLRRRSPSTRPTR